MKRTLKTAVATLLSMIVAATVSFAADAKTPDVKGAVKPAAATAVEAKKSATDAKTAVKGKIVDINTATDAELKSVPGIGDAYAAKIIAGRPYANKAQLKSRNILPSTVYEQVKELLIAKQGKADTKVPAKKK